MGIATQRLPASHGTFPLSNHVRAAIAGALLLACPGAALAQVKSFAFVPAYLDNNVTVVDTAGHSVVGSAIPTGNAPNSASASPDGRRVYVANGTDSLTVIDVATRAVIGPPIPVGAGPWGVTFTKDGRTAYVSNQIGNSLSIIDVAADGVSGPPIVLPVNSAPRKIAITPDGLRAYVSSNHGVYPIDLTTKTAGAVIPLGGSVGTIAITADGKTAFATVLTTNLGRRHQRHRHAPAID